MLYEHSHSVGNNYIHINDHTNINFDFQLHLHKSFELVSVEEGEMTVHISGNDFSVKSKECALILPGQPHSYHTQEHSVSWICIFSPDCVSDFSKYCSAGNKHYPVFRLEDENFHTKLSVVQDNRFRLKSMLYELAAIYASGPRYDRFQLENNDLICNIVQYIEAHFTEPLTLHRLATEFGYNYRYMSMLVSRCFHTSFSQVVNQYRISYACTLLREGDYSITEVSEQCGFDSQRNFNRNFKAITSMTPREYLQKKI